MEDFIAKYSNQATLYPGQSEEYRGQCVQLVMLFIKGVQGLEPPVYPDAKDYWNAPVYTQVSKDETPQDGDLIVYGTEPASEPGHIGVFYQGQIFEQNANPDGSPAHLYPFSERPTTYLLGYLRKEEEMPTVLNTNQAREDYLLFGIDLPGDSQALLNAVGADELEFIKGMGPQVQNNLKAKDNEIDTLQGQLAAAQAVVPAPVSQPVLPVATVVTLPPTPVTVSPQPVTQPPVAPTESLWDLIKTLLGIKKG